VPLLARAAGHEGMAGGQAIDLASVGMALNEDQLRDMHRLKTGALLQGSVMMGAACGNATRAALAACATTARRMGLAFQVVDDILDVTADSPRWARPPARTLQQDKPTYVSLLGLDRARAHARELLAHALDALAPAAWPTLPRLSALAHMVVDRDN
jgi:farnesyl diphosphate synthase